MDRIPEPWQLADAHYARLEERYEAMIADAVCGGCNNYNEAPAEWVSEPCGWCSWHLDFTLEQQRVKGECDYYEPRG